MCTPLDSLRLAGSSRHCLGGSTKIHWSLGGHMRNIPVDTSNLAFVCVSPPRPKLLNQETGEVKLDRNGEAVYQVGLSVANEAGRVDLVTVAITGDPGVTLGQV